MKSFYNTVGLTNKRLVDAIKKADTQQNAIYLVFKGNPKKHFSPTDIYNIFKKSMLLTSVRRAISNLTSEGKLIKTDKKVDGQYGVVNLTWKFKQ
jgi:hypothetical protein